MKFHFMVSVVVLVTSIVSSVMAQQDHEKTGQSALANSVLVTPPAIQLEHKHLRQELAAALAAGGNTAEAAKKVEAVLTPHFAEEEAYAMPPLGLLETIVRGQQPTGEQVREAVEMSHKLRVNYDRMLAEHRKLTAALQQLTAAAEEEKKKKQSEFAEILMVHAENEEQVLYPASLLVGDYLNLKKSSVSH